MQVEGRVEVRCPPGRAEERLTDLTRLAGCVPGLVSVTPPEGERFAAEMVLDLPFVRLPTRVEGAVLRREPGALTFTLTGRPRTLAGSFRAEVALSWRPADPPEEGRTAVAYRLEVTLQGRLASLGEAMVRATSEAKAREFEEHLTALLESSHGS